MKNKAFALVFALGTAVWAQQQQQPMDPQQQSQGPDEDEGPGRGVARISLMNGDVSVKRGDTGELVAATVNSPLMVSDRVLTGPGSRAELQFDSTNLLRLGEVAEVRMTELEWQRYMIQVAAGTVTFRVIRDNNQAQIELNTPTVAVRPLKRGEYRITVREDGSTEITVRSGELEIFTQRGTERLKSGRTMLARGTASDPEVQIVAAPARDDFDRWNQDRDRYFERSQVYDNMSSDIYGGEDLDAAGSWVNYPQYGRVWVPRVNSGWAPYRDGRWVYYDWYGWTWVSNDNWGWAPYHYGRWFHDASIGWGWWPGGGAGGGRRHYWRPAFVSFFGWGGGGGGGARAGIGFGFGNVGWVPLAPYEPCYGWWGRNRYNGWRNNGFYGGNAIVNNVSITNIYRNARVQNGITSMGSGDFGRRRVNDGNMVRARLQDLQGAGVVRGSLPVAPERGVSTRLTDRDPRGSGYARTNEDSRGFRTREPARVDRVPFEEQRRGTEELARRGVDRGAAGASAAGDRTNAGWRRTGENGGGAAAAPVVPNGGENSNGWRRFGDTQRTTGREVDPNAGAGRARGGDRPQATADPAAVREPSRNQPARDRVGNAEDGWRRFGGSSRETIAAPAAPVSTSPENGGSRIRERSNPNPSQNSDGFGGRGNRGGSFGGGGGGGREAPRMERQQQQQRNPEPVRISPPIVRERSGDGGSRGSGGENRRGNK